MTTGARPSPRRLSVLRTLSLVLAFTAATGLIFGTAGFTAMEADRGLAVNVADDDSAYLGYSPIEANDTLESGEATAVVAFHNQFGHELALHVTVESDGEHLREADVTLPEQGAKDAVAVELTCPDERRDVSLSFHVEGHSGGTSVSLDRTRTVTCVPATPTVTGVRYAGIGNAFVETRERNGTVEAVVWTTTANPSEGDIGGTLAAEGVADLQTSKSVRRQLSSPDGERRIAVVAFPDQDVAFFHPGWTGENHGDPRAGDGVAFTDLPLDAETVENTSVVDDGVD